MRTSYETIDYIMKLAEGKEINQTELARMVGYPKSTMSRYVSHSRPFPINDIGKFAKALNVSISELLDIPVTAQFKHLSAAVNIMRNTKVLQSSSDVVGVVKEELLNALRKDIDEMT